MVQRPSAAVVVLIALLSGCTAPPGAQAQSDLMTRPGAGPSFAPLVRRVVPAVVSIAVLEGAQDAVEIPPELRGTPAERLLRERLRRRSVRGAGAGFLIDPSGIIVTNSHVVGHATRITVGLADGRDLPATVVGVDALTDIAVVKVDGGGKLPSVAWGDSRTVEVGDWILAAGNPFGVGTSVTSGIVSARGRDIGAGPFDDFIQIDASINPGNSGGPTFNMQGEVIAVNTAIVSPTGGSVGIGFAIPSEIASHVVDELRAKGHIDRGWLGVSLQDAAARGEGVMIAAVERSSPASRGGLRPGDTILAVNDTRVESGVGMVRTIANIPPGGVAKLSVRRGSQTFDLSVRVGTRPADPEE